MRRGRLRWSAARRPAGGSPKFQAPSSKEIPSSKFQTESRSRLFLRFEQREEDHIAYRFCAGKQHCQSIHAEAETAGRRHTVLEREQKVFVDLLCFFAGLLEQTLTLHERIIELGITRRDLHAIDDQFEDVDERFVGAVLSRQRYEFLWTMRHQQRGESSF